MFNTTLVGIDPSMNGTGLYKLSIGPDACPDYKEYLSFTTVKKLSDETEHGEVIHYKKSDFENFMEQRFWMYDKILEFLLKEPITNYIAMEDYSLGSKGLVFNIAEFVGGIKNMIYRARIPLRMYEPSVVKKFATGRGNSDKISMCDEYYKDMNPFDKTDLSHLNRYKSPETDIIDAYYIVKFLHKEHLLKSHVIRLEDLNPIEMELFTRVTKANKIPLYEREFLHG